MQTMEEKILAYIKRNRVSSTEIADCLGKTGAIDGVTTVNRGHFRCGRVKYVYAHSESNWSVHEQIRDTRAGDVVLMDAIGVNGRALVGELVCKFLLLYREASAVVSLGKLRDANDLIKNNFAVWCPGFTPVGCFNRNVAESDDVKAVVQERKRLYERSIAVCDDTGVVIVPKESITEDFYNALCHIEQQEDDWFNCIDFKKWDTFETVCLKRKEQI